tara:strand:- start:392 stop:904 length:513 start_codon:yes stop_codon:yes gene_type:complete
MTKSRIFLTLTGYQITWLSCIYGESKFNAPLLGIYVGIIYLLFFFYFNKNKKRFLKISFSISLVGYLFDTTMVFHSVYFFDESLVFGTLPIWMTVLWLSFSTLFDEILMIFKRYKLLGVLISGVSGPLTYYLGVPIGILQINNMIFFIIFMVIFWSLLMVYYLEIILRNN